MSRTLGNPAQLALLPIRAALAEVGHGRRLCRPPLSENREKPASDLRRRFCRLHSVRCGSSVARRHK